MRSGESSIEQRPDTRICVVQRISDGMKECEGDGCQMKSAAFEKECRTSGGQTDMTDHRCATAILFAALRVRYERILLNGLTGEKQDLTTAETC